jgi:UDP-N-acetylmuramoyl-L-alanyl-D-glutamate--2,6-diaminopimelate ligase
MPISNGVKNLIKKFIPSFLLDWYHFILAFFGAFFYCFPSKKLKVIGVTGTKGKSTVVEMTARILEKSGYKTASISSIKFKIGEKEWPNTLKMTMPGRFKLQKFLRQAVKEDCKCAVLEITSEGIKQHRHRFIDFDGAVFTNLTPEHIEAHKGFENYKKAKGKLFQLVEKSKKKNKFSVINIDDSNADYFLNFNTGRKYTYAINNKNAEITPEKISLKISLPAEFNIYNSLAAVCVGLSQGIDLDKILNILKEIKGIPGRMELVIEKPFKVFVDYAHTSDSLEKVYKTLGKGLICVFGSCGGGRDKWKRPEMGKIAVRYCDKIVLTNEDPYDENPSQILSEIKSGIPDTKYKIQDTIYEILDRREAINKALNLAKKDDIVIITGKGCEPWMCVAHGKKIPWDDRKIVKEEFEKIYG